MYPGPSICYLGVPTQKAAVVWKILDFSGWPEKAWKGDATLRREVNG